VEIFLELNANEWSEGKIGISHDAKFNISNKYFDLETCHGNETVPRANLSGLEPQVVQNCAGME
jgi:hypothetical protein